MALIKLKVFCFCLSYWLLNIIDLFVFVVSIRLLSRKLCKDPLNLSTMKHENFFFCGIFHMETWMLCETIYFIGCIWVMWYAQIENIINERNFFNIKTFELWINGSLYSHIHFLLLIFYAYCTFNHGHNFPSKRRSCQRCRLHSFTYRKISHSGRGYA